MGLSTTFDVNRVTNLETRATTDEAVMLTTNNQGRQTIPYLNVSGTANALISIVDPAANACYWGIQQDATYFNLALGRFTTGSKATEIRSYYDNFTIRTGRSSSATSADMNFITNDQNVAAISNNINLMPRGWLNMCPNNGGVNTNGVQCLLTLTGGFPAFRSINTATSNMMLKFASNGLHAKDFGDTTFEPFYGSAFNVSSHRKFKENIQDFSGSVLEKIKNTPVRKYKLKDKDQEQIGLIFDEAPKDLQARDGETLQLYDTIAYLWKAVQELTNKVEELEA